MTRPSYGIDAPGLVRGFVAIGMIALVVTIVSVRIGWTLPAVATSLVALYGLSMATLMVVWSRFLKSRERDAVLAALTWRGDEQVLDVGCGRGLMLIGAAARLVPGKGRATGIDIWRASDQWQNTVEAVSANVASAGVQDRVAVETADMRALPFADARFDLVLSHWAVHNLDAAADRDLALGEMARVLRPGGTVVLADIAYRDLYSNRLAALGLSDQRRIAPPMRNAVLAALSFGSFRPGWIVARRGRLD